MARPICPVCRTASLGLPWNPRGFRVALCRSCGHRFAESAIAADDLYGHEYTGFRDDPVFDANVRRFFVGELGAELRPGARLLDVGCGNGTVLAVAAELGVEARGIDSSAAAVAHCVGRGLRADVGDFPTHAFEANQRFDVITFWDVLEHVEEPARFVDRARSLLTDSGVVVFKVPGHGDLSVLLAGAVPRLAGPIVQLPAHLQFYSRSSLEALLRGRFRSLRFVESGPMRSPGAGGSWRRRISRRVVAGIQALSGDRGLLVVARAR